MASELATPTSCYTDLLLALPDDVPVLRVCIGAFLTAVVVDRGGYLRCGLASAMRRDNHQEVGPSPVAEAGRLHRRSGRELAELLLSESTLEASIGMAAVNALLPVDENACSELNAEEMIVERGAGRRVAVVGHFPFMPRLREVVSELWILEQRPKPGDLPAEDAAKVIPQADVVAITGTSLLNHTFEGLVRLCRPGAFVLILGPSTPLSPLLFHYGVHALSGTVVDDVETVLRYVEQGATFRQLHHHGVRLLTMCREGAR